MELYHKQSYEGDNDSYWASQIFFFFFLMKNYFNLQVF